MKSISLSDGLRFGVGIDSATLSPRANAIEFESVTGGGQGQKTTATFKKIESMEQLVDEMDLSVAASVNIGLFSADAKFKLVEKTAINEFSVYVLAKVLVSNPATYMVKPKLTAEATKVYLRDPNEFFMTFGDSYLDEVHAGGEFYGIFSFHTKDQNTSSAISADLNMSYGSVFSGVEINAEFNKTVQKFSKSSTLEITAFISGGTGISNPTELKDLVEIYKSFNSQVAIAPINQRGSLKELRYLPLPEGPVWTDQSIRKETIDTAGKNILQAIQLKHKIQYILDNSIQFENIDDIKRPELKDKIDALEIKIKNLADRARLCSTDISQCSLENIDSIDVPILPKRISTQTPIEMKLDWLRSHNSTAASQFPAEGAAEQPNPAKYDIVENGQYWYYRPVPNNQPGPNIPASAGIFQAKGSTDAFAIWGILFKAYIEQYGGCAGQLGFPTSDIQTKSKTPGELEVTFFKNALVLKKDGSIVLENRLHLFPTDQLVKRTTNDYVRNASQYLNR
jgi:hypothetical protein